MALAAPITLATEACVVVGLFVLVLVRDLAKEEARGWLPVLSRWIIRRAVQKLPVGKRDILEDMEAQLEERSERPLTMFSFAVGVARNQRRIAAEARAFAPGPALTGTSDGGRSDTPDDLAVQNQRSGGRGLGGLLEAFEAMYREQFGAVVSYFARRCEDPQLVADLTADTFVTAIRAFRDYDPTTATPRAWAIGIARKVWIRYRGSDPRAEDHARRRSIERLLDPAETEELSLLIDVESASRDLFERLEQMPRSDREAVDLVDLSGLSPAEAARELGVSQAGVRVRLARSHARLGRE
jgi:RNA polymerase sigma factor (sigma-70 family)